MDYAAMWTFAFPYLIIVGVFYVVLILPQRKREKKVMQMLKALKVGDKVITIGGIIGVIAEIKDDEVLIESDSTKIKITRWAVREVMESK